MNAIKNSKDFFAHGDYQTIHVDGKCIGMILYTKQTTYRRHHQGSNDWTITIPMIFGDYEDHYAMGYSCKKGYEPAIQCGRTCGITEGYDVYRRYPTLYGNKVRKKVNKENVEVICHSAIMEPLKYKDTYSWSGEEKEVALHPYDVDKIEHIEFPNKYEDLLFNLNEIASFLDKSEWLHKETQNGRIAMYNTKTDQFFYMEKSGQILRYPESPMDERIWSSTWTGSCVHYRFPDLEKLAQESQEEAEKEDDDEPTIRERRPRSSSCKNRH